MSKWSTKSIVIGSLWLTYTIFVFVYNAIPEAVRQLFITVIDWIKNNPNSMLMITWAILTVTLAFLWYLKTERNEEEQKRKDRLAKEEAEMSASEILYPTKAPETSTPVLSYQEEGSDHRQFVIKVAGVTFDNEDGTKRQEIIKQLSRGDRVEFIVGEYEGKPSVRIDSLKGTIGYVPKENAVEISNKIKHEIFERAYIENVYGGDGDKSLGIAVMVVVKNETYGYKK